MSIEPSRSPAVPAPGRLGQGTAIEQSRAAAEVHARVVVAQQVPRRIDIAEREMLASCAQEALAERAFYRYPRSGQTVTGPSVHLARELARCWGNVDYGISELRRDDDAGQSEMLAWAWDLQTNTRSGQIFIVPHGRDTRDGRKALIELRDIYENNANMGARRLRESIFAILPPWFTEQAKEACTATLRRGDGSPLADRIAGCIAGFGGIGVREPQLVQKIGRPAKAWTELDLAQLAVAFRSIERGEITKDEEFGPDRVTAAEIHRQAAMPSAPIGIQADTPAEPSAGHEATEQPAEPDPVAAKRPVRKRAAPPSIFEATTPTAAAGDWPDVAQPPDVDGGVQRRATPAADGSP